MVSSRSISLRLLAPPLLLAGGLLWAYLPCIREMMGKWFNNPQYSHAYLVPLFSAYLLWRDRENRPDGSAGPAWLGLAPLLAGIILRLIGSFFYISWLEMISLVPVLCGVALLLGGWPALRWSWVPIAFLLFMLPLPYRLETALSQPLQSVASRVSAYTLQTLGWSAFREGNIIHVNQYEVGVVEACNGLGMMLLFFAMSTGMALVMARAWPERVVLLVSAVPIAVVANAARIVLTGILYDLGGQRLGDLVFHDLAGWLMMPLALGLLWLELFVMSRLLVEVPVEDLPEAGFVPTHLVEHQYVPS